MFLGGDELYRSQRGNNNAYNLDNAATWLDWSTLSSEDATHAFVRGVLRMRHDHAALRPGVHFDFTDHDGNGLSDVTVLAESGMPADASLLDDGARRFVAFRFDGGEAHDSARSLYVAYNWGWETRTVTFPAAAPGLLWHMAANSDLGWSFALGEEPAVDRTTYDVAPRSVVVFVER
jgi:glycogen operon protein